MIIAPIVAVYFKEALFPALKMSYCGWRGYGSINNGNVKNQSGRKWHSIEIFHTWPEEITKMA